MVEVLVDDLAIGVLAIAVHSGTRTDWSSL